MNYATAGMGKDVFVEMTPSILNKISGEKYSSKNIVQKISEVMETELSEKDIEVIIDAAKSGIIEFTEPFVIQAFYENSDTNTTIEDITEHIISTAILSGAVNAIDIKPAHRGFIKAVLKEFKSEDK